MGTTNIPYLLNLFNETLWMLPSSQLKVMTDLLKTKLETGSIKEYLELLDQDPREDFTEPVEIEERIASMSLFGTFVAEATTLQTLCGFSSTFNMNKQFNELSENSEIDTIVLHFRSGGGESTGLFEFANDINNSSKRVIAFTDTMMASAAYLLGSAADVIVATPSAELGSIGVRMSIVKVESPSNVEIHTFQAGGQKTFGDPHIAITEAEKSFFQGRVDKMFKEFVSAVSVHRDWLVQSIIDTEAGSDKAMFLTETKFVDKVMSTNQFLTEVRNGSI